MASSLFSQQPRQQEPKRVELKDIMQELQSTGLTPEQLFFKKIKEQGAMPDLSNIMQQAQAMAAQYLRM